MRREWIEIARPDASARRWVRLPPCGGSGLKYEKNTSNLKYNLVSLHAEGVD